VAPGIKTAHLDKTGQVLKWVSIALTILGAADAIYLLVLKYSQSEAMCVGSHGCITVNNSSYSMIYGIPVSLLGLIAYLAIGASLILESYWKHAHNHGPLLTFGATLIGVIFSAYLTWIELLIIHATCPFCLISAVVISIIFILAVIRLVRQNIH
jgi:uncharacterized membrane protein